MSSGTQMNPEVKGIYVSWKLYGLKVKGSYVSQRLYKRKAQGRLKIAMSATEAHNTHII